MNSVEEIMFFGVGWQHDEGNGDTCQDHSLSLANLYSMSSIKDLKDVQENEKKDLKDTQEKEMKNTQEINKDEMKNTQEKEMKDLGDRQKMEMKDLKDMK